jgi:hypothetical protein
MQQQHVGLDVSLEQTSIWRRRQCRSDNLARQVPVVSENYFRADAYANDGLLSSPG